jgi:hypothetical protein
MAGVGNIAVDPKLQDGMHLANTSPCRGTGSTVAASGTDLDGKPWAKPPSMGCSEVWEADLVGPLTVALEAPRAEIATCGQLLLTGRVTGRASRLEWSFGDGITRTNLGWQIGWSWPTAGDYPVTVRAFNVDHPAGVSASMLVHVVPCNTPSLSLGVVQASVRQLSFPGQFGVTYVVQQTTNLIPPVTWQTLSTVTSTGQVMQVLDSKATNATRFYRTQVP